MFKRLIVCCDGTWNTADQATAGGPCPTNITKLALSIVPEDSAGVRQCVYYHSGVGTSRWERLTVGALGIPALGPRWLKPIAKRINHRREFHDTKLSTRVDGAFHELAIDEQRVAFEPRLWHQQSGADGQELKQVWFAGAHCDIGGYPDTSLSDIALLWIADRARDGACQVPGRFSGRAPRIGARGRLAVWRAQPYSAMDAAPAASEKSGTPG